MYFKYINSFAHNLFVFCFNLKILVKTLVGCSCRVPSEKLLINFCLLLHDDLFCSRDSQQFPIYLNFRSQAIWLTLRKESRINGIAEMQRSWHISWGAAIYQALNCEVKHNGLIHDRTCLDTFERAWTCLAGQLSSCACELALLKIWNNCLWFSFVPPA